MTLTMNKKMRRQEAYRARAGAARLLGKLLTVALLGTMSFAAWSEPRIKAQLETGLAVYGPIVARWIDSSATPPPDQTAQLEEEAALAGTSLPTSQIKINRP